MQKKNNNLKKGRVSVVTVTYNAEDFLESTIKSIINQTYEDIEYIVIDGLSTDRTPDIIQQYIESIDIYISEKDNGIYDAMNKAIDVATGEWIIFMNAGDNFYNNEVVHDVFANTPVDAELVYGRHVWKNGDKEFVIPTRPLEEMWQRISFSHQSLFSKTALMQEKKFDLSYKIVCDYEFYFSLYMQGKKFHNSNIIISTVSAGGFSDVSFFTRTYERWSVVKQHKKSIEMHKFYFNLVLDHIIKEKIAKNLLKKNRSK